MEWIVIIGYALALTVVCAFSLEQFSLALIYRRFKKKKPVDTPTLSEFPLVTVQLPVYNEKYVINRLIDCVCQLDYPKDKLEIQVLDDSTDETFDLSNIQATYWKEKGIDISVVRRPERSGYKAGALAYGLKKAKGKFIAIFDADFLPKPDFLLKTLNHFDSEVGMVQTKWGHINEDYSLLTRMQAFGLDAHFTVEQTGRASSGKFMNFNGTAGVWRKTCIEEAGGWQADTLTEDLDLSYRAQVKGWKFRYVEDVVTPAELPVIVPAIKSQQYRWNKGAAETAKKNLGTVLRSKLSRHIKFHAALHLLNSSVFIFLVVGAVLSVPLLFMKASAPETTLAYNLASIFVVGFVAMAFFYWIAANSRQKKESLVFYLTHFPLFLIFSMGMSLHNAIAVTEGYLGIKTPFIRTPKFDIKLKTDSWKGNIYLTNVLTPTTILEGLLALYFLFGIIYGLFIQDYGLLLFHAMLMLGFGAVFFYSVRSVSHE